MKDTENDLKNVEKNFKKCHKTALQFKEFCYIINNAKNGKEIKAKLKISYKTIQLWRSRMKFIEKIGQVTLDRAIKEALFRKKEQIKCFDYLVQDVNYWSSYEEVAKVLPNLSRYHFKAVKDYIKEELTKINSCN
jgi:hypothetical protein